MALKKVGIYISIIQFLLLFFCILCSVVYYHKQEVIASTHPFFIKREQIIREFGIRKGLKKLVISSKIRIFIGENQ